MEIESDAVKAAICDLVIRGDLDGLDIAIMRARDCSPMPTFREIATELDCGVATVSRHMEHIKAAITAQIGIIE